MRCRDRGRCLQFGGGACRGCAHVERDRTEDLQSENLVEGRTPLRKGIVEARAFSSGRRRDVSRTEPLTHDAGTDGSYD